MKLMTCRRRTVNPDIRSLGGVMTITPGRDRVDGDAFFEVSYVGGGGDIVFRSGRILDEDQAHAAARVLADFVGAVFPDGGR